jgi:toxin secretion/phage lysis holin
METGKFTDVLGSVILSIGSFFFGGFGGLLLALTAFIIIDYVTGLGAAAVKKQLSAAAGAKGIAKKVSILLIVALGHILDTYIIGNGDYLMTMVVLFYIANEGLSILENAVTLGVRVPGKLKEVLLRVSEEDVKKQ